MIEWKAEKRITRGKGDTERKEPRALHKAAWTFLCTAADAIGSKRVHWWCGKRHGTADEAERHAVQLNSNRDASEQLRSVGQARARKRAA